MTEKIVKRRGRKSINIEDKATAKNITLYDNHYEIIEDKKIELSEFSRWLSKNCKEEYQKSEKKNKYDGNSVPTSLSLYREDYKLIEDIDNFSNFIRWGLENKVKNYVQ